MNEQAAPEELDTALLHDFMRNFFGYGNPRASVWLIGMEEGAGRGFREIKARLGAWARSRRQFEDARDYHIAFGLDECFTETPKSSKTWTRLIRLLLATRGVDADRNRLLDIQRSRWGRLSGSVCLAELLPLPNPNTSHWCYDHWTADPDLCTRRSYRKAWLAPRVAALRQLLSDHRPAVVVFYGKSNLQHWQAIAETSLVPQSEMDLGVAHRNGTYWFSIRHPGDYLPDDYFDRAGQLIGRTAGRQHFVGIE